MVWSAAFLPVNSRIKRLLWHVHVHFDCAGSHKVWAAILGRGIFPASSRVKWPFGDVQVHFDCAGLHKTCGLLLGCGLRIKWLLWHVHARFGCAGSRKVCAALWVCGIFILNSRINGLLWGPCMILYRSLTEDLVEILLRSSFQLLAPSV